ncbi:winged helix-turn-helix transcriptional regulator, partial [Streptomyces sp. NPDC051740]
PRVEYSLTEDGGHLNDALRPLAAWGRERTTAQERRVPLSQKGGLSE